MSFVAPKWLRNPHLQTVWPHFFRKVDKPPLQRERLELADGDFLDLFSAQMVDQPKGHICLFHGLEGSVESSYMRGMMWRLLHGGYRVSALHFRSTNGLPNRLARAYHSGETGDIRYILNLLAKRHPNIPLGAMGISLGGNALLVYLGEQKEDTPLRLAVAISAPIDLADSCKRIAKGLSFVYQRKFLRTLRKTVQMKEKLLHEAGIDVQRGLDAVNFYQFDDAITAPLHGFSGASDYYFRASACRTLQAIAIPTLMLQSEDDPLLGPKCMPDPNKVSSTVEIETTKQGGHVGFVYGTPWHPKFYIEDRTMAFVERFFQ